MRLNQRLQQVENVVARLVAGVSKFDHSTPVLACLHWLSILSWIRFNNLTLTYKA